MLVGWQNRALVSLLFWKAPIVTQATSNFSDVHSPKLGFIASSFGKKKTAMAQSMSSTVSANRYWNREDSKPGNYDKNDPIVQDARIVALSRSDDLANEAVLQGRLPKGATLVGAGSTMDEILSSSTSEDSPDGYLTKLQQEIKPNILYISYIPNAKEVCAEILKKLPSIEWIHARSAGIDFMTSDTLTSKSRSETASFQVTNAKGCFSSTLAEYTLMACAYFAKDLPRLLKQKRNKDWNKYSVLELRGATLGVIGYGDIGRSASKLAKAYGMKVIALKRKRPVSKKQVNDEDPYCDQCLFYDKNDPDDDALNKLFSLSDYVLCSLPLTQDTTGMITRSHFFDHAKPDCVFINVGRGPIVDEDAMIDALKSRRIKGAGLDVVAVEPLPTESELWELDNVLLSP